MSQTAALAPVEGAGAAVQVGVDERVVTKVELPGIGRAEDRDRRSAQRHRHVRGTAVVPDEETRARDDRRGLSERRPARPVKDAGAGLAGHFVAESEFSRRTQEHDLEPQLRDQTLRQPGVVDRRPSFRRPDGTGHDRGEGLRDDLQPLEESPSGVRVRLGDVEPGRPGRRVDAERRQRVQVSPDEQPAGAKRAPEKPDSDGVPDLALGVRRPDGDPGRAHDPRSPHVPVQVDDGRIAGVAQFTRERRRPAPGRRVELVNAPDGRMRR